MFCRWKCINSWIFFERDIDKISIIFCFNYIFEDFSNRFISLKSKSSKERGNWEFSWFIDSSNNISVFFYAYLKPWTVFRNEFERVPKIFWSVKNTIWSNNLRNHNSLNSIDNIWSWWCHKWQDTYICTLIKKYLFCRFFLWILFIFINFYKFYLCSDNPSVSQFLFLTNFHWFHRLWHLQIWNRDIKLIPCNIPNFFFIGKESIEIDIDKVIIPFLLQIKKIWDFSISSWLRKEDSSCLWILIISSKKFLSLWTKLIIFFFNRRNRLTIFRSLFCCGLFFIYHQVCYREINGNKWTVSHPAKLLLLKRTRFSKTTSIVCSGFNNSLNKVKTDKKVWFLSFFIFCLWNIDNQSLKHKKSYK